MSVVKGKRSESQMEFLYKAREIEIYSIKKCTNFPKRYTFYISQPMCLSATNIHKYSKMGNSLYPQNQHEAQIRRDYFLKAQAEAYALISQIEVAHEVFALEHKVMSHWAEMVNDFLRLIKGVLQSDRKRYKTLPQV